MDTFWSELTKKIEPYQAGEQPKDRKYIKLNTNENPYPPSPKAIEAIKRAAGENLKLYPEPTCVRLCDTIAKYYGLDSENIFVGNGSDEVLAFAFPAFFNPGEKIVFPDVSYSFYPVFAKLFGLDFETIPLDDDFKIVPEMYGGKNGGVIIPNPNAPTGIGLPLMGIRKILELNPKKVVVIDEAYIDFGGESAYNLVNEFKNLLVVQTLSKARSLAGIRVGFAIGDKDLIQALCRIKNSFNSYTVDMPAMAAAAASFEDEEYFALTKEKIIRTRERVIARLRDMDFKVLDSQANFIFISPPAKNAAEIFTRLREKGILVRYFNKERIKDFLRVSIGDDSEMDAFIKVLNDII